MLLPDPVVPSTATQWLVVGQAIALSRVTGRGYDAVTCQLAWLASDGLDGTDMTAPESPTVKQAMIVANNRSPDRGAAVQLRIDRMCIVPAFRPPSWCDLPPLFKKRRDDWVNPTRRRGNL